MTPRQFSVIRRRPKLVDIITPFVYGISEYRIKWASNFDASFTQIIAANRNGYLDPKVNQSVLQYAPGNHVRIAFDPTNPAYSIPSDDQAIWLKLARYDGTSETYVSPPTLLLPDSANHGVGIVTIAGDAPSGATSANSLQIDLPFNACDLRVSVTAGSVLYLSTDKGGPETQIATGTIGQYLTYSATQGSIWVRGSSGTSTFSMQFTRAYPK